MKTQVTLLLLSLTLVCGTPAFAHGGKTHVMGTLSALDGEHIVVEDREGKTVFIRLNKDTNYKNGDAPAAAADLKVGYRVVVDVIGKPADFTATEIRFSIVPQAGEEGAHHPDHP